MPSDLLNFLIARLPDLDSQAAWAAGGAYLTGLPTGPPLLPPGRAASLATALGEWVQRQGQIPEEFTFVGAELLSERAGYTGFGRQGSITSGGAGRILELHDGSLAAASCARVDDPILYGAALGVPVPSADPWSAIISGMARSTPADVRRMALELSLPCWPVDHSCPAVPYPRSTPQLARHPRDFSRVRVVDFSSLWAGPLCAHLLGLSGAEVIKVESVQRPDGARFGNKPFYDLLHSGHRSISFDPADQKSLFALRELVASADIVIEASRPRALKRLGIDAESYVAAGATWVSITAAGRASSRIGFGDDVAASAGLIAQAHDGTPCFVGDAIADPLAGLFAAAVCMTVPADNASTALGHQLGGELWDISMYDAVRFAMHDGAAASQRTPSHSLPTAIQPATRPLPPRAEAPKLGADNAALLNGLPIGEGATDD